MDSPPSAANYISLFWGAASLKRLGTRPEPLSYTLLLSLTELLIALLLTVIALKFLQYQLL